MKIIFISDIHGMPGALQKVLAYADDLKANRIVLLGDILYHGPRNGVPHLYDPTAVVKLLNERCSSITAVRGNCDAEVDQMLLKFPIMSDYSELLCGEFRFFLTHGHLWNENSLPDLPQDAFLVHGHTHIAVMKKLNNGPHIFNPGSISLPKNNDPATFGFFDGKKLQILKVEDAQEFNRKGCEK